MYVARVSMDSTVPVKPPPVVISSPARNGVSDEKQDTGEQVLEDVLERKADRDATNPEG